MLDVEPYRYQKFISDIAGHDIRAHGGKPEKATMAVRDWLAAASRRRQLPGGAEIVKRYNLFSADLPGLCQEANLEPGSLTFRDLTSLIAAWLKTSR